MFQLTVVVVPGGSVVGPMVVVGPGVVVASGFKLQLFVLHVHVYKKRIMPFLFC